MPLLLLVPFGPLLAWKRGDLARRGAAAVRRLRARRRRRSSRSFAFDARRTRRSRRSASASALLADAWARSPSSIARARAGSALRWRPSCAAPPACRARPGARPSRMPASASRCIGIVAPTAWGVERIATLKPGDGAGRRPATRSRFEASCRATGRTTARRSALLRVRRGGAPVTRIEPGEAHLRRRARCRPPKPACSRVGLSQLYVSARRDRAPTARVGVRLYWKPLVLLIWLGAVVMALGGALSLTDRRLRVGAPGRRGRAAPPLPAE